MVDRENKKSNGRVVVVSGAGAGMGRATAQKFCADGATVVGADIDRAALEGTAKLCGANFVGVETNVADELAVDNLFKASVLANGIDVLVCSAGIQRYGTVEQTTAEVWDQVLNVNLRSIFLLSRRAVPLLRKRGGGAIVNVASVQAFASQTGVAAYTASKGAIVALTKAMALDHAADQIRVTAVCPGSVDTPMLRWAAEKFGGAGNVDKTVASWGKMHPLGRVCRPEEVAELIYFLASPNGAFITGSAHAIDGGLLAALGVALPD